MTYIEKDDLRIVNMELIEHYEDYYWKYKVKQTSPSFFEVDNPGLYVYERDNVLKTPMSVVH